MTHFEAIEKIKQLCDDEPGSVRLQVAAICEKVLSESIVKQTHDSRDLPEIISNIRRLSDMRGQNGL